MSSPYDPEYRDYTSAPQVPQNSVPQYDSNYPASGQQPMYSQQVPMNQGVAPFSVQNMDGPHPSSLVVLVLGVLGCFVPIASFVAWYMGRQAKREVAAGQYGPSPMNTAGYVLGVIMSIGQILAIVGLIFLMVAGMAANVQ